MPFWMKKVRREGVSKEISDAGYLFGERRKKNFKTHFLMSRLASEEVMHAGMTLENVFLEVLEEHIFGGSHIFLEKSLKMRNK